MEKIVIDDEIACVLPLLKMKAFERENADPAVYSFNA
jgi:hypothetical protein